MSPQLTLSLQLNEPERIDPDNSLINRIKCRGSDLTTFATRLSSANEISTVFPQPPKKGHLYVLVYRTSAGESQLSILLILPC